MPVITSLEVQKHNAERVNVYLDGKFGFGASLMLIMARDLSQGRELSEEEIGELQRDDAVERAFAAALNFLSYRPRSRREIEDYFRRKKSEPEVVTAVVERLERTGFLNDGEFARFWVENRQSFRPRGTMALRMEMRQKGLPPEVIDGALETLDEDDAAYRAGQAKLRSYAKHDEREFFRKMVAFLQRRGFPYGPASTAARRLYQEHQPKEDAEES